MDDNEPLPLLKDRFFKLSDEVGYNPSERFLSTLCRRSFLSLWAAPNTYRAHNKELIDVLVVFGDDVILFSDKDIKFNGNKTIDVAWPRWCKRAIDDSVRQLRRAKRWITEHPDRVFIDRAATTRLPISLPDAARAKYHLVATARGAFDACSTFFEGGYGSLIVDSLGMELWCPERPFRVSCRDGDLFVHIFDEGSIGLLLTELDTISDFTSYLSEREAFLSPTAAVVAEGEEQLLACYLSNSDGVKQSFLLTHTQLPKGHILHFDSSHAPSFFMDERYLAKKQADLRSYAWDRLIETFVQIGDPAHVGEPDVPPGDVELALRTMASEPRFMRRILSNALLDFFKIAEGGDPEEQRFRIASYSEMKGTAYVFFVFPKDPDKSFEEYRDDRKTRLMVYLQCLLAKHESIDTAVGLGFDHPKRVYQSHSEDLLVVQRGKPMSDQERSDILKIAGELGILGDSLKMHRTSHQNFPSLGDEDEGDRARKRGKSKKKRQQRIQKKSRKKNRR